MRSAFRRAAAARGSQQRRMCTTKAQSNTGSVASTLIGSALVTTAGLVLGLKTSEGFRRAVEERYPTAVRLIGSATTLAGSTNTEEVDGASAVERIRKKSAVLSTAGRFNSGKHQKAPTTKSTDKLPASLNTKTDTNVFEEWREDAQASASAKELAILDTLVTSTDEPEVVAEMKEEIAHIPAEKLEAIARRVSSGEPENVEEIAEETLLSNLTSNEAAHGEDVVEKVTGSPHPDVDESTAAVEEAALAAAAAAARAETSKAELLQAEVDTTPPPPPNGHPLTSSSEAALVQARAEALAATLDEVQSVLQKGLLESLDSDVDEAMVTDGNTDQNVDTLKKSLQVVKSQLRKRTQLEAVRLSECLSRQEEMLRQRYETAFQTQVEEWSSQQVAQFRQQVEHLQLAAQAEIAEREKMLSEEFSKKLETALQAQAEALNRKKDIELEEQKHEFNVKQIQANKDRAKAAERLQKHANAFYEVSEKQTNYRLASHKAHFAALAALSLAQRIANQEELNMKSSEDTLGPALLAVQLACPGDPVVEAAIRTIPTGLFSGPIPTKMQLTTKLAAVKENTLDAAFVPEGAETSIIGQALGKATSMLLTTPREGSKSFAQGTTPLHRFARAEYLAAAGDIEGAVAEMEDLEKYLKAGNSHLVSNWLEEAKKRAILDQTISLLRTHIMM
eukprot:g4464.t1